VAGGLQTGVPLLGRLRVSAEPRHGRLRARSRRRLRRGVVVLGARLTVPVAAQERLARRRTLDLHHYVPVLHAVYTQQLLTPFQYMRVAEKELGVNAVLLSEARLTKTPA